MCHSANLSPLQVVNQGLLRETGPVRIYIQCHVVWNLLGHTQIYLIGFSTVVETLGMHAGFPLHNAVLDMFGPAKV